MQSGAFVQSGILAVSGQTVPLSDGVKLGAIALLPGAEAPQGGSAGES